MIFFFSVKHKPTNQGQQRLAFEFSFSSWCSNAWAWWLWQYRTWWPKTSFNMNGASQQQLNTRMWALSLKVTWRIITTWILWNKWCKRKIDIWTLEMHNAINSCDLSWEAAHLQRRKKAIKQPSSRGLSLKVTLGGQIDRVGDGANGLELCIRQKKNSNYALHFMGKGSFLRYWTTRTRTLSRFKSS